MINACIMVQLRREFFHSWPEAPYAVDFLRHKHRHVFHVKLSLPVTHSDRQKEFFIVQRWLAKALPDEGSDLGSMSCEDIATLVVKSAASQFKCTIECEVWEDGENGARVTYDYDEDDDL